MKRRSGAGRRVWVCHTCNAEFDRYTAAERHVDSEHGGARIECMVRR